MSWRQTVTLGLLLLSPTPLHAGDWPQILGPSRSGQAEDETLPETLVASKHKPQWTRKLGGGYAGPVVVGQKVIVFHRVEDNEVVEAFDAGSGKPIWRAPSPANYRGGVDADIGPRCSPVVSQNSVFAYGAAGDLVCVALDTGKIQWRRELLADYDAEEGYFGAGSTPILIGGKLLVNVGGKNAGIVALDPLTGKTLWQATKEAASYASPTAAKFGGKEQAIFVTRLNCVAVDPANGKATTLFAFGRTGPTVNAATPLVADGKLLVTASYGVGAGLYQLAGGSAREVWANGDSLSSQYNTPVIDRGHVYGIHGREDVGTASLRCVELATGKVKWSQDGFGCAHAILAKDKVLLVGVEGKLTLISANPNKYDELGALEVGRSPLRALPALSGGKLIVRTSAGGGGELLCIPLTP